MPPSRTTGTAVLGSPPRRRRLLRHADVLGVVSVGGALGSLTRYAVTTQLPTGPDAFPSGTFLVNVLGCLVLGAVMVLTTEVRPPGRYLRPFLGVGVLGGFTTFSTVTAETRALAESGSWLLAEVYVAGSVLAGLGAACLGVVVTRRLTRGRGDR